MKRLERCCCCCTLKTGTVTTGVLGILLSIATILFIFLYDGVKFRTIVLDWLPETAVNIILVLNLCMTILICLFLIIGALRRKSWFMLPWVALGIVLAIGLLVSVLYTSISLFLDRQNEDGRFNPTATAILIVGILYFVIFLYLWAVVFSHYLNVKDEEERGRYMKPPYRR